MRCAIDDFRKSVDTGRQTAVYVYVPKRKEAGDVKKGNSRCGRYRQAKRTCEALTRNTGETLMTFESMQLKVCEGCGSLWVRSSAVSVVYCRSCIVKLADFPHVGRDRRPGRKKAVVLAINGGTR
jgi:hypothetical protein